MHVADTRQAESHSLREEGTTKGKSPKPFYKLFSETGQRFQLLSIRDDISSLKPDMLEELDKHLSFKSKACKDHDLGVKAMFQD